MSLLWLLLPVGGWLLWRHYDRKPTPWEEFERDLGSGELLQVAALKFLQGTVPKYDMHEPRFFLTNGNLLLFLIPFEGYVYYVFRLPRQKCDLWLLMDGEVLRSAFFLHPISQKRYDVEIDMSHMGLVASLIESIQQLVRSQ